jgi:hypothetical protein
MSRKQWDKFFPWHRSSTQNTSLSTKLQRGLQKALASRGAGAGAGTATATGTGQELQELAHHGLSFAAAIGADASPTQATEGGSAAF